MGVEDASLELLREIRSHPVALAQCGDLFVERADGLSGVGFMTLRELRWQWPNWVTPPWPR